MDFKALHERTLNRHAILSMTHQAHLDARGFDSIGGEVVLTTALVLENMHNPEYRGVYIRLVDGNSVAEKITMLSKAVTQGSAE